MTSSLPTDSYLFLTGEDAESADWPVTPFPEYTDDHLHQFVDHLWAACNGELVSGISALSSAGLYTLVVVMARVAGLGNQPPMVHRPVGAQLPAAVPELLAELRRRDRPDVGDGPAGPVRRGRLLRLVGGFTSLSQLGSTTHQRQKLSGACPFCDDAASFQVSLPAVTWRCFGCERSGGRREFAECLLTRALAHSAAPGHP